MTKYDIYNRRYRERHPERTRRDLAKLHAWTREHPQTMAKNRKRWKQAHADEVRKLNNINVKRYRERHPDYIANWQRKHADAIKRSSQRYYRRNRARSRYISQRSSTRSFIRYTDDVSKLKRLRRIGKQALPKAKHRHMPKLKSK